MFTITVKVGEDQKPVKATDLPKIVKSHEKHDANLKLNAHVVCIVIGIAITIACTFSTSVLILHFAGMLATLPAFVQELIDWLRDW